VSDKTAIEWTDATWNPVTGCSKVSPGCANRLDAALGRLDLDDLDYRTEPAGVTALEPNEPELWVPYERLRAAFARLAKDPTDEPEGIVQRAHVACSHCWCGEHHEEGR
jgi:hypothetical protein